MRLHRDNGGVCLWWVAGQCIGEVREKMADSSEAEIAAEQTAKEHSESAFCLCVLIV